MRTETADNSSTTIHLVDRASLFLYDLFKERLPEDVTYHSYEHTVETAKAAEDIGRKEGLDDDQLLLVTLAAWFHDAGFVEGRDEHEKRSAMLAREYLEKEGLDETSISEVERLILSTKSDQEPVDLLESVLHDADLIHLGKRKKFFRFSEKLRREWEGERGREYSELEWAEVQLKFLTTTDFKTDYARKKYGKNRRQNLKTVQSRISELLSDEVRKNGSDTPSRGVETMFRTAYRNHINLSQIADSKANIMISINAILMSIIVSFVSTRLADAANVWLLIPATTMLITSLVAIVFAILGARPKVTSEVFSLEDVRRNRANILFFGNFVNMSPSEFNIGMREIMTDWDKLYDSMIHDLYSLGLVLQKKYRLLWFSYTVF
ncbi:MAG: Pycsar system effector family protein, partial [Rhodothermales bacterium]